MINKFRKVIFKDNFYFRLNFIQLVENIIRNFEDYFDDWFKENILEYSEIFGNYNNRNIGYMNFLTLSALIINGINNAKNKGKDIKKVNEKFEKYINIYESRYFITLKKKELKIFEEELIKKTWHPNRFFDWCLSIDEKNEN
jgi:hypothetical protein